MPVEHSDASGAMWAARPSVASSDGSEALDGYVSPNSLSPLGCDPVPC